MEKTGKAPFAVIFDMDGVIVDSNPFHKQAIGIFCQRHGLTFSEHQLESLVYGRTNRDWLTNLFGEIGQAQLQEYAREKEAIYRDLYQNSIVPLPGLKQFISQLQAGAVPLAIGTSAPPENVAFTLEKTRLAHFFPLVLDERAVILGKPDPEIYLKTAAALGYPPAKCIVFEDSLSGIAAAQAAGTKTVGVATTHQAAELAHSDAVIHDFTGIGRQWLEQFF